MSLIFTNCKLKNQTFLIVKPTPILDYLTVERATFEGFLHAEGKLWQWICTLTHIHGFNVHFNKLALILRAT